MSRSETVTITNMCMVYNGNSVLVQDKLSSDWGGITFPGGHVEKGESFTNAVIREVFEETGLIITSPQLCGIKDWTNNDGSRYMVLLYKTDKFSGNLKSSDEGPVFWISLDEFHNASLAPDMDEMLKVFLWDDYSEFFYYRSDDGWKYELK